MPSIIFLVYSSKIVVQVFRAWLAVSLNLTYNTWSIMEAYIPEELYTSPIKQNNLRNSVRKYIPYH